MALPLTNIGQILNGDMQRDAIHIAVAPVIAEHSLMPGQHIGLTKQGNSTIVGMCSDPIGIVDPFLKTTVEAGQQFYMFLYPNTITGLNHLWSHPAFDQAAVDMVVDKLTGRDVARKWIQEFADRFNISYEDLMDAADEYVDYGDYLSRGDKFEGVSTPPEFWDHYAKVKGTEPEDKGNFFRCSC